MHPLVQAVETATATLASVRAMKDLLEPIAMLTTALVGSFVMMLEIATSKSAVVLETAFQSTLK